MLSKFVYTAVLGATGVVANIFQQPVVLHEGNSTGEVKTINGVNIYHAYHPTKSNDNAILFFTDIFGLALPQNRLLADSYARAGYLVLIPDYFKGDPIPTNQDNFNRTAWRDRHPQSEVTSIIETTVKYARETLKVKKLGATGFCFGGPYVVRQLAANKGVDAGFIAHPGAFTNDELNAITGPLTIAAAETDNSLPPARRHEVEDILTKRGATYQINLYAGASHGFAVRVDMKNKKQVFAKEAAFYQALLWFDEWLKGSTTPSTTGSKYVANGHGEQSEYQSSGNDLRVQHDFDYSY